MAEPIGLGVVPTATGIRVLVVAVNDNYSETIAHIDYTFEQGAEFALKLLEALGD